MENFILIMSLVIMALYFIFLIRNNLVYNIRSRAIDTIHFLHREEIAKYNIYTNCYFLLKNPSYYEMIFMVYKWTYKSFYNNLETTVKRIQEEARVGVSNKSI